MLMKSWLRGSLYIIHFLSPQIIYYFFVSRNAARLIQVENSLKHHLKFERKFSEFLHNNSIIPLFFNVFKDNSYSKGYKVKRRA